MLLTNYVIVTSHSDCSRKFLE